MDKVTPAGANYTVQRRVAGYHDVRMDGISDLVLRCSDKSVFDIGCNRGMVGLEFAMNGARKVHGIDIYEQGILTAREVFADLRSVESRFEVCDLTKGPAAVKALFGGPYDFVLCLATYHKITRVMPADRLGELMRHFGSMTKRYFAWRATSDKPDQNDAEMKTLDRDLHSCGLARVHTSYLSHELGVAAVWERK
jgi:2-polyprenyl-3-methyl-5-hydroxy-6-metoxy-1,4-benzoquinol methylase